MKIAIVLGTRPEIIKMAPIIDKLQNESISFTLIHTGQHYDYEMSDQFFFELELPSPDYNIGVGSCSHGKMTGKMITGIEKTLKKEDPNLVLVQGDTNATLAGALAASKMHIAVGHVEAGLRSFDKSMPEEINRVITDMCSTIHYAPTEEAALNLIFEGLNPKNIYITGNTVVDACIRNLKIAKKKKKNIAKKLNSGKIITITLHRAENVDNKNRLYDIVKALKELDEFNIVFPIHPRTRKNLKKFGLYSELKKCEHVHILKPLGYLDFLLLLSESFIVLTDSGGVQEEAITLNVPCLTLRYNTERIETVDAGGNILVGTRKDKIIKYVRLIANNKKFREKMKNATNPYGDGKASERIIESIINASKDGKLKISPSEKFMKIPKRTLKYVKENMTVVEFEETYDVNVQVVYENGKPKFPYPNLNLKNKHVLITSI